MHAIQALQEARFEPPKEGPVLVLATEMVTGPSTLEKSILRSQKCRFSFFQFTTKVRTTPCQTQRRRFLQADLHDPPDGPGHLLHTVTSPGLPHEAASSGRSGNGSNGSPGQPRCLVRSLTRSGDSVYPARRQARQRAAYPCPWGLTRCSEERTRAGSTPPWGSPSSHTQCPRTSEVTGCCVFS